MAGSNATGHQCTPTRAGRVAARGTQGTSPRANGNVPRAETGVVADRLPAPMRRDLRAVRDGTATEAQWQRVLIGYAKARGWLAHHTPAAQVRPGKHVTPTQGHIGFPDVVLVREPRVVLVELKSSGGPTPEQQIWLNRLARCDGVESYLWWPRDWPAARATLR